MSFLSPKMPKIPEPKEPPPAPTIDEARQNADETNRRKKRTGRKDLVFAGNTAGGAAGLSNVGTKTLTGQ